MTTVRFFSIIWFFFSLRPFIQGFSSSARCHRRRTTTLMSFSVDRLRLPSFVTSRASSALAAVAVVIMPPLVTTMVVPTLPVLAAPQVAVDPTDVSRLKRGLQEISFLLNNWEEKTTYCNFGYYKNELLKTENKEELLEAAKKYGLLDYDKSATMNVLCKRDPEVVRAFLGVTKENLVLANVDVLLKKASTVDRVDADEIDSYFEAVDRFTEAIAAADSLAYQARTDYSSTEVFKKGDDSMMTGGKADYLAQAKVQVTKVRDALQIICNDLHL